jgi:hypothetical protein
MQGLLDYELKLLVQKHYPHSVDLPFPFFGTGAYSYCFDNFGKRAYHPSGDYDLSARWEWYSGPHFKTEEDAVLFKLGYGS